MLVVAPRGNAGPCFSLYPVVNVGKVNTRPPAGGRSANIYYGVIEREGKSDTIQ